MYKTTGCDAFRRAGGCRRGDYCAFIHPGDQLVEISRRAFKREPYGEHTDASIAEGEEQGAWVETPPPAEADGSTAVAVGAVDGAGGDSEGVGAPPSGVSGQQDQWYVCACFF